MSLPHVALVFLQSVIVAFPRASDVFQDWWAEMTHGAKNGGSFSEMMGPMHIYSEKQLKDIKI